MRFDWDEHKNQLLKNTRGVCFEDILVAIGEERLLDVLPHHNVDKYPHQKIFIVRIRDYIYYVPFVEDSETIFLKNIIPSRKYHKQYFKEAQHGD